MAGPPEARGEDPVEQAWREQRVAVVASLARRFGDLDLAEDAVQEAFMAAGRRWPIDGTPDRPGAWIATTAYRKAIGMIRRRRPTHRLDDTLLRLPTTDPPDPAGAGAGIGGPLADDVFGLILTCCHPALAPDARVTLTLRHVCGLSVGQIAAGFVVAEDTMAKRLVRARRKIRDARISFALPEATDLTSRLSDVRAVIYLVFTEGHLASGTGPAVRGELCEEAVWLTERLHDLCPDDETTGLLALLLVHHARHAARTDTDGALVRLADQDRDLWDHQAIERGRSLLAETSGSWLGPYRVEAAIALLHVTGPEPSWPRIADLYGVLSRLSPSPIVEVNRAYAVGQADGPTAGLAVLAPVLALTTMATYPSLHAVHTHLLAAVGDDAAASSARERALETAPNDAYRNAPTRHLDLPT